MHFDTRTRLGRLIVVAYKYRDKSPFKSLPFEKTLRMLKSGYVDIIPTLSYKKEREEYMTFSKSYRDTTKFVFVAGCNSEIVINCDPDLERYRIGVVKDYNYAGEFVNNERIVKEECMNEELMFAKLVKGQVDALIINEFTLSDYVKTHNLKGKVKVLNYTITDNTSDTRMAFSKAKNLEGIKKAFEEGLEELKRDGTLESIYKKYTSIS